MNEKKLTDSKIIPDTSVLIKGNLSALVETGKIQGELIILESVLSELENQANRKQPIGFQGLDELGKLKQLADAGKIKLTFHGTRPTPDEIKAARFGAIDSAIRDAAVQLGAKLLTADYVMYLASKARGLDCEHISIAVSENLKIEDFFDKETMSVHLKVGTKPVAKRGRPGQVRVEKISEKEMTEAELDSIIKEIIEYGRENRKIEMSAHGSTVVQMGDIRVAIAEPPFSERVEITAVRPIVKIGFDDYKMTPKLRKRLEDCAEGVFICGPPGAGKSSFAAALAEFYQRKGAIVKTMESPRDLQVNKYITQYAPLEGSMEKTADVLLLVRPDYTIYDEVRKTNDFRIFADMRLAGIGMVGVTHASTPLNAIQRLVSRLELGQIPHIVDTIVFIKDGEIKQVYETRMAVKVPVGMHDDDLARPVIEVLEFETSRPIYEIYTFGDQTVVMPTSKTGAGRTGGGQQQLTGSAAQVSQNKNEFILSFGPECAGRELKIYAGRNFLFKASFDRGTQLALRKKSRLGKLVERAVKHGDEISAG